MVLNIRLNIVALVVSGIAGSVFVRLSVMRGMDIQDVAITAIMTFATIRAYDFIAGMPAFKQGGEKKNK